MRTIPTSITFWGGKIKIVTAGLFLILSANVTGQKHEGSASEIHQVLKAQTPARGVYKFYSEFLANSPSITDSFYVSTTPRSEPIWNGTSSVEVSFVNRNKKVKNVWGFSDGKHAYIFNQVEFFPIEVEGDKLIFYGYEQMDNAGVGTAAVIGGTIGLEITLTEASREAKSEKLKYTINLPTGTVLHPKGSRRQAPIRRNKLIVYRRSRKESDLPAKFKVDESLLYSFEQKSYVFLSYPLSDTTATICSGKEFKDCISITLNPEEITYVECTFLKGSEKANLILQDPRQGEIDFFKVKSAQDKRGKQEPEIIKE